MHKRTTPKTFARAKELHRNMTPAEVKLWARLRAHGLEDVHFRRHCLRRHQAAIKALGDMSRRARYRKIYRRLSLAPIARTVCAPRRKFIIELDGTPFGRNIWNKNRMMKKEQRIWNRKAIKSFACGTMM